MKIRKKLLSLLGAAAMAVTVMAVAGGAQEVKAASNTYVVNSSVADVTGNVGDTIEVPITFTTDTPTNSLLGKLRDNKNNVSYSEICRNRVQRNASRTDFHSRRKLLLCVNRNQHKRNYHFKI